MTSRSSRTEGRPQLIPRIVNITNINSICSYYTYTTHTKVRFRHGNPCWKQYRKGEYGFSHKRYGMLTNSRLLGQNLLLHIICFIYRNPPHSGKNRSGRYQYNQQKYRKGSEHKKTIKRLRHPRQRFQPYFQEYSVNEVQWDNVQLLQEATQSETHKITRLQDIPFHCRYYSFPMRSCYPTQSGLIYRYPQS